MKCDASFAHSFLRQAITLGALLAESLNLFVGVATVFNITDILGAGMFQCSLLLFRRERAEQTFHGTSCNMLPIRFSISSAIFLDALIFSA